MEHMDAGALVGWKAKSLGSRIVLNVQTMHQSEYGSEKEMRERAVLIERNHAVLLANYLYEITGQSKPRRRSFLQSIFGT
ncbi:MAG TPA: hypothetical protein DCS24_03460 [Erythrobacter sp.]|nr:hypothetical protein [Erythrobacter sp.]